MPSKSFDYTGGWQKWSRPKGVEWVYVTLNGGGSGSRGGGRITGRLNVKNIATLYVLVGQKGQLATSKSGGKAALGGGAAGGDGTVHGGDGGGGATYLRAGSTTGSIKAVAGGAGGSSGKDGLGGRGGADVGEAGGPAQGYPGAFQPNPDTFPELWDYLDVGNATGGTQSQGGNRGTSATSTNNDGHDAFDTALVRGGAGGTGDYGGGGGGGGYHSGGGGQGGVIDVSPDGGGGGGSNYVEAMIDTVSLRGQGGTGHGSVLLSWVAPPPANQPPTAPSEPHIGGRDATNEIATLSTGKVTISAKVNDPNNKNDVRLIVQYSADRGFKAGVRSVRSGFVDRGKRASVNLSNLSKNTLYYVRLYGQDRAGLTSRNYSGFSFWTNRSPKAPNVYTPGDNATIPELTTVVFEWTHQDDDPNSSQKAFTLRWRRAATPGVKAGEWVERVQSSWDSYWTESPGTFKANTYYEYQIKTQDEQGSWGPYSTPRSFFITGETAPPLARDPSRGEAVSVNEPVTFTWIFRDPTDAETQGKADLRYRVVGASDWITLLGTSEYPGSEESWTLPEGTLGPGYRYEWQVRTQDSALSDTSDWSDSEFFWTVSTPGIDISEVLPTATQITGQLGCGDNRVFIYDRGGKVMRGEVTPMTRVTWNRKRDDISNAIIDTNGFGPDCGSLLSEVRCWMHEMVIFRDGVRVWEGPITRITSQEDSVEIEAKDVMGYVYRRIMRQGYNDAYRVINGEQLGLSTVVRRAARIIMNALAPDDPNVLAYLSTLDFPDDAQLSRSVYDFAKTAWEEVDDLAATAGLDYTTVGRRIILNDTHRPVGRLAEMRSEHFSDPPVISEYGMLLATGFGVTNNNGVYGMAERDNTPENPYGLIEQLASAYGEAESSGTEETMTAESRTQLEEVLAGQAERNISGRWPTPMVVRVPDNSTLAADTPVQINDLIPGVWIPLRAKSAIRELSQWQKLDLMQVEQTSQGERVMVTMSPAPNAGQDPDADAAAAEEA